MRKIDFSLDFKQMTCVEVEGVTSIMTNYLYINADIYGIDSGDLKYKLTYTSSNANLIPGLYVDGLYYDRNGRELEVVAFALAWTSDKKETMLIIICHDEFENKLYYELEPNKF